MNANNFNKNIILDMMHSPVRNYVVPGLTSWLIGEPSKHGCMRVFTCEREHQECLTPHSHRFDFQSWVLQGQVQNIVWKQAAESDKNADLFQTTLLEYKGKIGQYEKHIGSVEKWRANTMTYKEGDCYSMTAAEVHSIRFGRGAIVLFFEGPQVADSSIIIEPFVDDVAIPTFRVEDWMFKRGEK